MSNHLQFDNLDRKIISMLMKNARMPFLEVARECGVSGAAIHQRVQRLTKLGIIIGSQINVDPQKLGFKTCAYMGIYLENAGLFHDVADKLRKLPEIVECHYTTGEYAMFVKIFAQDNDHLRKVLAEDIQHINGISRTETFISLDAIIDRPIELESEV
jgi:Lrp/AsnC family transcriptional regulator for asnA, asnC and gidA